MVQLISDYLSAFFQKDQKCVAKKNDHKNQSPIKCKDEEKSTVKLEDLLNQCNMHEIMHNFSFNKNQ